MVNSFFKLTVFSVFGIGAFINVAATFMCAYVKDFPTFLLVYGAIGGFSIGFAVRSLSLFLLL